MERSLLHYAGRSIYLQYGTYNDGLYGTIAIGLGILDTTMKSTMIVILIHNVWGIIARGINLFHLYER